MTKNSTNCFNSYRVRYLLFLGLIGACAACNRVEKAAPGQPTMKEMMQRRAASTSDHAAKYEAFNKRVQSLTADEAQRLLSELKKNPQDAETYSTLLRYYEKEVNIPELNSLKLWYIEHHPEGQLPPGNINPRHDRAAYEKGRALWLAHVKRNPESFEIHSRAADFLGGGDKPLAEKILLAGRAAYPKDDRWVNVLARNYTHVIHGATEPYTEYNVFRMVSSDEAHSVFAQDVIARLSQSNDVSVLASTALSLLQNSGRRGLREQNRVDAAALARTFLTRALEIDPGSARARGIEKALNDYELNQRIVRLMTIKSAERSALPPADKRLLTLAQMQYAWSDQKIDEAEAKARELLTLAQQDDDDPLYEHLVFAGNMVLGKVAFRKGDRKASVRHLSSAARGGPFDGLGLWHGFDMNLPRALVDAGERTAVAEFLEALAPKMRESKRYQDWAAEIRKGINPDLMPTMTSHTCTNDPC